jgi:hypothetical protein
MLSQHVRSKHQWLTLSKQRFLGHLPNNPMMIKLLTVQLGKGRQLNGVLEVVGASKSEHYQVF